MSDGWNNERADPVAIGGERSTRSERRRAAQEQREKPWTPVDRNRPITKALRAYAEAERAAGFDPRSGWAGSGAA